MLSVLESVFNSFSTGVSHREAEVIDIPIERLIPHRDRMKLVDRILGVETDAATTESTAGPNWPLASETGIHPLVLVELVAQSAAVSIGWKELMETGAAVGSGWLVGIKSAVFPADPIPAGSRITTRAEIRFNMDNYTEIHGVCRAGDPEAVIGSVTLQVMRGEKEKADGEDVG